jgi:hypothetical protein
MMRRILIAVAIIATLVSPARAQLIGQPSGQGSTAPANPNVPQVAAPLPAESMRPSGEVSPGLSQYQPMTQSQLNQIHPNPNQSRPAQPEGPLR